MWEQVANAHLARAGLDIRIDHRSHQERGLEIEPTEHMGVHATQMERRGKAVGRARLDREAAQRNAALIREKPEQVLSIITSEKSVFDRRDVARTLHRYIDGPEEFQSALAKVMASAGARRIAEAEQCDDARGDRGAGALFDARDGRDRTRHGFGSADRQVAEAREYGVERAACRGGFVGAAIPFRRAARGGSPRHRRGADRRCRRARGRGKIDDALGGAGGMGGARLPRPRGGARRQGGEGLGGIVGDRFAYAGLMGARLADTGATRSATGDVLVIDEAGMVSSRQLAHVHGRSRAEGRQDRSGRGSRAIAADPGWGGVPRRWRSASATSRSKACAGKGRIGSAAGVASLSPGIGRRKGSQPTPSAARCGFDETRDDAHARNRARYGGRHGGRARDGNRIVLAHRRADVRELNAAIREARQERGELAPGAEAGEVSFLTNDGERKFSEGDRIIFLENNRDLGVKNGMLGVVAGVSEGRLVARFDSAKGPDQGREVSVSVADYAAIDHGYATTIHKSQGATVDRAYVLASDRMDRHLSYVGHDAASRRGDALRRARRVQGPRGAVRAAVALAAPRRRRSITPSGGESPGAARSSFRTAKGRAPLSEHPPEPSRARETRAEAPAATEAGHVRRAQSRRRPVADGRASLLARKGRDAGSGNGAGRRATRRGETSWLTAVDGFARAWSDAARMRTANLPVLEHQKQALGRAGAALEAARPGGTRELLSALRHDPATRRAMAGLEGAERAVQLVAGMERERQAQLDPNVRAERTVATWHKLEQEHGRLRGFEHEEARGQIEARMKTLAGAIKRDPQMESVMRARSRELGIERGSKLDRLTEEKNVERAINRSVTRERDLGMER